MKVKLNQPATHKGKRCDKGDTLTVNARLGGAWVQTGKADEVLSKKGVRSSKRKQTDESGRKNSGSRKDSETDD